MSPPPRYINKPPISEMCIYIRHNLYKGGLDTQGGGQCSTDKKWGGGEGQLTTRSQRKITSLTFDKSIKFCKVVVHGLTNDISYDVKLKRSKI